MTIASPTETWITILTVAATAVAGDVLTAGAMRRIGDLDAIRAHSGLTGAIKAVVSSPMFLLGVFSMAASFFSLLFLTPAALFFLLFTSQLFAFFLPSTLFLLFLLAFLFQNG